MKPMPGAIVSQFGRLARSANNVPPLHLLVGIAAILVALTLATPFAFEAGGDNAFIALTIPAGLLTIVATHLAERVLSLGKVGIRSDRLRDRFAGARPHVKGARIAIDGARCVGLGEAGPGQGVVRVQIGG